MTPQPWHLRSGLGVDRTFLATTTAHSLLAWALAGLLQSEVLPNEVGEETWMFGIGCVASAVSLLAIWMACGPGRLAVRCLWAAAIVLVNWLVLTRAIWPDNEIVVVVTAAVCLVAASVGLLAAAVLRLARGLRLTRGPAETMAAGGQPAWQFRLADLLILMVVAALLVMSREWLSKLSIVYYHFGDDLDARIFYAIRTGGAVCAMTTLAGVLLLLREKQQAIWTIIAGALATTGAVLLTWLPFAEPIFGDLSNSVRAFGPVGAGSLVVALATLLPLRAWGWRYVRLPRD